MTARRWAPALALLAFACTGTDEPSADEVLEKMQAAIDVEHVRPSIQSLSTTAEGTGPDGLFETTVTSIPPASLYFREASPRGTTEIWSTPDSTWGGAAGEAYELLGPQVREFIRNQEFHAMLLDLRGRFSDFEFESRDSVEGTGCLRIAMRNEDGSAASICIAEEDWLPVELRLGPEAGAGTVRVIYRGWALEDGLNLFHSLQVIDDADRTYTWNFTEIALNQYARIRVPPPTLPRVRDANE